MKSTLSRLALAALLVGAAATLPATASAQEKRSLKISVPKGGTADQVRESLKKQGVPDAMIEQIIAKLQASGAFGASDGSAAPAATSGPGATSGGAPAGPKTEGAAPAAPAPVKADYLNAQALENKDPELAAIRKTIEELKQKKALLEAELALNDSKRREEFAPLAEERAKLEAERAIRAARTAAKNAAGDLEKARIDKEIAALNAQISRELNDKSRRIAAAEAQSRLLRAKADADAFAPAAATAIRKTALEAERVAASDPVYLDDPVKDGTLYISDRRIPFNGVVTDRLADFVEKRIEFFNNKDAKKPIFIVIDNSPGGSAFAGVRILKAMQGSRAPVIVVVKQYCASMAAITTTVADRSYVYPNTIVLHHQMSTGFQGTMTDLRQNLNFSEKLYENLFKPVYTKVINPETNRPYANTAEFEKAMYKRFASGDWAAFGDDAAKMKWAGATVERMVETGLRDMPVTPFGGMPLFAQGCVEKQDETGRTYYQLPPLAGPGDAWILTDPDHRFKAAE